MATLYWQNISTDNSWNNVINWFTDAGATTQSATVPWIDDGVGGVTNGGDDLTLATGETGAPTIAVNIDPNWIGITGACDIDGVTITFGTINGGTFSGDGFTNSSFGQGWPGAGGINGGTFSGNGFTLANNGVVSGGSFSGTGFTSQMGSQIRGGSFSGAGFVANYDISGGTFTNADVTFNDGVLTGGDFSGVTAFKIFGGTVYGPTNPATWGSNMDIEGGDFTNCPFLTLDGATIGASSLTFTGTIASGTFGGTIYLGSSFNGGVPGFITGGSFSGAIFAYYNSVISGGGFSGSVDAGGGTISGGTFDCGIFPVMFITGGTFNGAVTTDTSTSSGGIVISGTPTFSATSTLNAYCDISGGTFEGAVVISAGYTGYSPAITGGDFSTATSVSVSSGVWTQAALDVTSVWTISGGDFSGVTALLVDGATFSVDANVTTVTLGGNTTITTITSSGSPSLQGLIINGAHVICPFTNYGNIRSGTFDDVVTNDASANTDSFCISGGTFTAANSVNNGWISGGTWSGDGFSQRGGLIDGGIFSGASASVDNTAIAGGTWSNTSLTCVGIIGGSFTGGSVSDSGDSSGGTFTCDTYSNTRALEGGDFSGVKTSVTAVLDSSYGSSPVFAGCPLLYVTGANIGYAYSSFLDATAVDITGTFGWSGTLGANVTITGTTDFTGASGLYIDGSLITANDFVLSLGQIFNAGECTGTGFNNTALGQINGGVKINYSGFLGYSGGAQLWDYVGGTAFSGWNTSNSVWYINGYLSDLDSNGNGWDSQTQLYYLLGVATTLDSSGNGFYDGNVYNSGSSIGPTGWDNISTYYISGVAYPGLDSSGNGTSGGTRYYQGNAFSGTWYFQGPDTSATDNYWSTLTNWWTNSDGVSGGHPLTEMWTSGSDTAGDNLSLGSSAVYPPNTLGSAGVPTGVTGTCDIDGVFIQSGTHGGNWTGDGIQCYDYIFGGTWSGAGFTAYYNAQISGGIFSGAGFINYAMTDNTGDHGFISGGTFSGASFNNTGTITGGTFTGTGFTNTGTITDGTFTGASFSNNGTISGGIITGGTFTGTGFTNTGTITDGTFTGASFSNNGTISGGIITGGTFTGTGFTNTGTITGAKFGGNAVTTIIVKNQVTLTIDGLTLSAYQTLPQLDIVGAGLN
jgi:hypothetical protein